MVCLIEHLRHLGAKVETYNKHINDGGCGVYAATLGAGLLRRGIPTQVIVATHVPDRSLEDVRKKVDDVSNTFMWNRNGVYFTHIGLEIEYNGKFWHIHTSSVEEPNGKLGRWTLYPGRIPVDDVRLMANKAVGWNEMFNRQRIPAIKAMVQRGMRHYDQLKG